MVGGDIIINDNYILGHLYIPVIMVILLTVMIYFHRRHVLRYLYLINIFCYIAAIFCYFILINHPTGEDFSAQWMNAIPFIFIFVIFGGYFLSIMSLVAFVIEHAQRYTWAKVVLGIVGLAFLALLIIGAYLFFQGILSLKSG